MLQQKPIKFCKKAAQKILVFEKYKAVFMRTREEQV
jgi:hypothetical protein